MAKLTTVQIAEIFDARLDKDHVLEFQIRKEGQNGVEWVEVHMIEIQTLNCEKFRTFYSTKEENIQNANKF